ncbi:S41 family peptidase [Sinomicrobium weinanense]|uniref:Peptidase S41 n=1 Tax=Sinomicrobium weinanense TaxID=2842200 RepID=A0A926Q091_9FLAO|nr:S41 family peptidase [Sinomicrobium weinanense]MBC9794633.1 peptidase S41 [Sinomicrobium weinanense]MBU3124118.1 peptidase S41 [Sinomicrobium weinanense]
MKNHYIFILFFAHYCIYGQSQDFNFSFEDIEGETPMGWKLFGNENYDAFVDSTISEHGKNAAVIEYHGDHPEFKAWAYDIPAKYKGKKIKLSGYIKTENVTDGYAGLWMRIDPRVSFDNMQNRGITGTTDWKKYEITLDLKPDEAREIVFGGLLVGKGKMWIDDLQVSINGKLIEKAPLKKLSPAEKDREFDQGSRIKFPELNDKMISNLDLLGKIWGFLKYYHPEIGARNYNWDYELFRILPEYLRASTDKERDDTLYAWIEKYGSVEICNTCQATSEDAFLKPDLAWIDHSGLSPRLKDKLHYIQQNRHQGKHYYISSAPGSGNPEFRHENLYSQMFYPDEGFRLLALYRYWNMIQYYFPYKHLISKDWNKTLKTYIPKFIHAKNELEYELATLRIIGDIQDTHANLYGQNNAIREWKGALRAPVVTRFIENKLTVIDYYNPKFKDRTGLEKGDVITKINGKPVTTLIEEKLPYYPASNYTSQLLGMSRDLLRSNKSTIQINYIRDREELSKTLKLYHSDSLNITSWYRRGEADKSYKFLDGNIGYITLKSIKQKDIKKIKKEFMNARGIIVDIRNYPKTFVPFTLGSFFTSRLSPFVKITAANYNNPGEFTFTRTNKIPPKKKTFKGKVVVLVNENSLSQSEYTAMAFRAGDNVTIVGSTTAGADGNVSSINLPGGLRSAISGIGIYYPDGTETQQAGIVPDVEVLPTIQGIKEGRDEVLEKAIEIINND